MLKTVSSITNAIGALNYKGTWDANANSPTIVSSVGTKGDYYVVSVAGSTTINSESLWGVGDWIVFNGSIWQKIDGGDTGNFTAVTASSLTSGRVTYASTGGLLVDSAALTWDGTTLSATKFSGGFNGTVGATTPTTGSFTTVQAATTMGVGGTTPSASGAGISFPATQSASTDANTLDDYEEGTWTPTDASGASLSFTTANCRYTKIGRVVVIQGNITYPVTASGAAAQFTSFPFSAADSIYLSVIYSDASVASFTYLSGNTTNVFLLIPGLNVTNATMSGKFLTFSGTYAV